MEATAPLSNLLFSTCDQVYTLRERRYLSCPRTQPSVLLTTTTRSWRAPQTLFSSTIFHTPLFAFCPSMRPNMGTIFFFAEQSLIFRRFPSRTWLIGMVSRPGSQPRLRCFVVDRSVSGVRPRICKSAIARCLLLAELLSMLGDDQHSDICGYACFPFC